jgi:nitroreductase
MNRRALLAAGGTVIALSAGGVAAAVSRADAMHDYDSAVLRGRRALAANPAASELVRHATLAPSGHNTQPWRFRLRDGGIDITPDFARRTPVVDPDDHHLFIGLGAAAENLAVAAAASGTPGDWRFDPSTATIAFRYAPGRIGEPALFTAIPRRRSSRTDYDGKRISRSDQAALIAATKVPGVDIILLEGSALSTARDLVLSGNTVQMADVAFVRELKSWIRFNPERALATGDGLFSAASGSPVLPDWLGSAMFDRAFKAAGENDKYARQLRSTPLIAVFSGAEADPAHWTEVGRAAQRFALQATALGLSHAFMNQPVEVAALRPALAALAGLAGRRPDLMMRVGHGPTLPFSPRRPVAVVLT